MRIRNLGRTGLKVSSVCLGCMTFGGQADEAESTRIMETALDGGVNFFDTADVYTDGRSEEIVGRFLRDRRHSVVLATKFASKVGEGPNDVGGSRAHIMHAVEASLRRLGTDFIDLYQMHQVDAATPLDETLRALDDLVRAGKVRYVGCSNFEAWRLLKANWTSDRLGVARFDCIQPRYNLLWREIERELLPACQDQGTGVIVYNPIAGGLLSGKHRFETEPDAATRFAQQGPGPLYRRRYWHREHFDAGERLRPVAQSEGLTLPQFAIAWTLRHPAVTSAIVGATSAAQLSESLGGVDHSVSQGSVTECDRVWESIRGVVALAT